MLSKARFVLATLVALDLACAEAASSSCEAHIETLGCTAEGFTLDSCKSCVDSIDVGVFAAAGCTEPDYDVVEKGCGGETDEDDEEDDEEDEGDGEGFCSDSPGCGDAGPCFSEQGCQNGKRVWTGTMAGCASADVCASCFPDSPCGARVSTDTNDGNGEGEGEGGGKSVDCKSLPKFEGEAANTFFGTPEDAWVRCLDNGNLLQANAMLFAGECYNGAHHTCEQHCIKDGYAPVDLGDTSGKGIADAFFGREEKCQPSPGPNCADKYAPYDSTKVVDPAKFHQDAEKQGQLYISGPEIHSGSSSDPHTGHAKGTWINIPTILKDEKGKECRDPTSTCSCETCSSACNPVQQCLSFTEGKDKALGASDPRNFLLNSDCSQPWVQIIHDNLLVPVNEVMAGYFSCTVEDVIEERAFSVKTGTQEQGLVNLKCQGPSVASPEFVKKALAKTSSMMLNAVDRCATNTIAMRTVAVQPKSLAPMGEARAVDAYGADLAMTLQLTNQFTTESNNQWFTDFGLKAETQKKLSALFAKFRITTAGTPAQRASGELKVLGNLEGLRAVLAAIDADPKKYSMCLYPGGYNPSGWTLDVRKVIVIPAIQAELKAHQAELGIADVEAFVAEIVADAKPPKQDPAVGSQSFGSTTTATEALSFYFGGSGNGLGGDHERSGAYALLKNLLDRAAWSKRSPQMPRATLAKLLKVFGALGLIKTDTDSRRKCFLAESELLANADKYMAYGVVDFTKVLGNPVVHKAIKETLGMTDAEAKTFVAEVDATCAAPWAGCAAPEPTAAAPTNITTAPTNETTVTTAFTCKKFEDDYVAKNKVPLATMNPKEQRALWNVANATKFEMCPTVANAAVADGCKEATECLAIAQQLLDGGSNSGASDLAVGIAAVVAAVATTLL